MPETLFDLKLKLSDLGSEDAANKLGKALGVIEQKSQNIANLQERYNKALASGNLSAAANIQKQIDRQTASLDALTKKVEETAQADIQAAQQSQLFGASIQGIAEVANPAIAALTIVIGVLGGVLAASAGVTKELLDQALAQQKLTESSGLSAAAATGFSLAVERFGGSANQAGAGLAKLRQLIQDGVKDTTKAREVQDALGVSFIDSAGKARSVEAVLNDISKAAQAGKLSQEQLTAVTEIFGPRAAATIIPALSSFQQFQDMAKKTGLVLSDDVLKSADELRGGFAEVQNTIKGFVLQLGAGLVPAFESVVKEAQIVIETLKSDGRFTDGIQSLINIASAFIKEVGPATIDLVGGIVGNIAQIASGVEALLSPLTTLENLLGIQVSVTNEAKKAATDHATALKDGSAAANVQAASLQVLEGNLKRLMEATQAVTIVEKAATDLRIAQLTAVKDQGIIGEQTLQKEVAKLKEEGLANAIKIARQELDLIINNGGQGLAYEKILSAAKAKLLEADTAKLQFETTNRSKMLQDAFNQETNLQKLLFDDLKDQESQKTAIINQEEKTRQITHEQAEQEKAKATKDRINQEIADLQMEASLFPELSDQRIALNNQLLAKIREFNAADLASTQATETAKRKDQQETFDGRVAMLNREQAERQRILNEDILEERAAGVTEMDIAQQIDDFKKRALQEQLELKSQEIAMLEMEGAAVAQIQNALAQREVLETEIRDIVLQRVGAVADELKKEAEGLAKLKDTADQANQAGISLGESFTFDPKNLQTAIDRIKQLQDQLSALKSSPFFTSFLGEIMATEMEILTLQNKVQQQQIADAKAASLKQEQDQLKIAEETATKANDIVQKALMAEEALRQQHQQKVAQLQQMLVDSETTFFDDTKKAQTSLNNDLEKLQDAYNKKITALDAQALKDRLQQQRDFEQAVADTMRSQQDQSLKDSITFEEDMQKILDNISSLMMQAMSAATNPQQAQQVQTQLAAQMMALQQLMAENNKRLDRERRKAADIAKAQSESKNADEFNARKNALDMQYQLEADQDAALMQLGANASAATIQAVKDFFAQRQKLIQDALNDELARQKAAEDQKAADDAAARMALLTDLNQQLMDRQASFDMEQAQRVAQQTQRIMMIQSQLNDERKTYNDARKKIVDDAIMNLQNLGVQVGLNDKGFQDLFNNASSDAEGFQKIIDQIIKKVQDLTKAVNNLQPPPPPTTSSNTSGTNAPTGVNAPNKEGGNPFSSIGVPAGSQTVATTNQSNEINIKIENKNEFILNIAGLLSDKKTESELTTFIEDKFDELIEKENRELRTQLKQLGLTPALLG